MPRRKENVINLLVLTVLVCAGLFTYHRLVGLRVGSAVPGPQTDVGGDADVLVETHVVPDYSKSRDGPGENGAGVFLTGEEKEIGDKQMKTWFMNVVAR